MNTEEPLVNLDFEETKSTNIQSVIIPKKRRDENHQRLVSVDLEDEITVDDYDEEEARENQINSTIVELVDDRNSIISLSSSSTTEEICLVPEIRFEGVNLDSGTDNRESQPLLGGRGGCDEAHSNHVHGESLINSEIINKIEIVVHFSKFTLQ